MNKAVCVIHSRIINGKEYFLSVSRKDNFEDFGFPAGKVENKDESPFHTAIRELEEETGFTCQQSKVFKIATLIDNGYEIHAYYVSELIHLDVSLEEGIVAWVSEKKITSGTFGEINKEILSQLNNWRHYEGI